MANQQLFAQSTYPLTGDIQSTPGTPQVTTVGFQGTPVVPNKPKDGQVYVYVASINAWVPADPIVSGPNAIGTPPTANPVQVGGLNGNVVQELALDSSGKVVISELGGEADIMSQILLELRAIKAVLIAHDNTLLPQDFDSTSFSDPFVTQSVLP
jgi:hypothetical protein